MTARAKKKAVFHHRITIDLEGDEELELTTLVGLAEEAADRTLEGTGLRAKIGIEWAALEPQIYIRQPKEGA